MSTFLPAVTLLNAEADDAAVEVTTPHGTFTVTLGLSGGALVVFIDSNDLEPTPDRLRVNVNDGEVFNYAEATRWYGEDQGYPAPSSRKAGA
jgi:hypothetical protein